MRYTIIWMIYIFHTFVVKMPEFVQILDLEG